MNLILCHSFDKDAVWLYLELKKLNIEVVMLAPEQVFMGQEWTQRLTTESADYVLHLQGHPAWHTGDISFLFNRTMLVEPPLWKLASEKDREYVRNELTALFMSWLWQVGKEGMVLNPCVGYNLCGVSWSKEQWARAAYDAGFPRIADSTGNPYAPANTLLVIRNSLIGPPVDTQTEQRCFRLARLAQSPMLEICLQGNNQVFSSATPFPAIRQYGHEFVSAIQYLIKESEQ